MLFVCVLCVEHLHWLRSQTQKLGDVQCKSLQSRKWQLGISLWLPDRHHSLQQALCHIIPWNALSLSKWCHHMLALVETLIMFSDNTEKQRSLPDIEDKTWANGMCDNLCLQDNSSLILLCYFHVQTPLVNECAYMYLAENRVPSTWDVMH